MHRIAELSRQRLKQEFTVYRRAAWQSGAESAGAGRGFAAQVDLAALFVERAWDLLRPGGTMAYLVPSKLWRSLAGGGVRELLAGHADIVSIEDLAESKSQFDAAVYPSLLVARRRIENPVSGDATAINQTTDDRIRVTVRSNGTARTWRCPSHRLSVDGSPGSPWLLLPGLVRKAFDRLARAAVPFHISRFGRPLLGVKTGCNDAYLVQVDSIVGDIAYISSRDRTGEIEREMLRPVIRGETLDHWTLTGHSEYLIWPHCDDGLSSS